MSLSSQLLLAKKQSLDELSTVATQPLGQYQYLIHPQTLFFGSHAPTPKYRWEQTVNVWMHLWCKHMLSRLAHFCQDLYYAHKASTLWVPSWSIGIELITCMCSRWPATRTYIHVSILHVSTCGDGQTARMYYGVKGKWVERNNVNRTARFYSLTLDTVVHTCNLYKSIVTIRERIIEYHSSHSPYSFKP